MNLAQRTRLLYLGTQVIFGVMGALIGSWLPLLFAFVFCLGVMCGQVLVGLELRKVRRS